MTPTEHARKALERAEKATPGAWRASTQDETRISVYVETELSGYFPICNAPIPASRFSGDQSEVRERKDADFIAHARTDVPALARAVIAAEDVIEAVRIDLAELVQHGVEIWEYGHNMPRTRFALNAYDKRSES